MVVPKKKLEKVSPNTLIIDEDESEERVVLEVEVVVAASVSEEEESELEEELELEPLPLASKMVVVPALRSTLMVSEVLDTVNLISYRPAGRLIAPVLLMQQPIWSINFELTGIGDPAAIDEETDETRTAVGSTGISPNTHCVPPRAPVFLSL